MCSSPFAKYFVQPADSSEVYLDSAATSKRLMASVATANQYYSDFNANVHRGLYTSASKATAEYEQARKQVADFINAPSADNIVFTSGATHAINLVANGLQVTDLNGDTLLVCRSEHHANLVPWQQLAKHLNLKFVAIELAEYGIYDHSILNNALAQIDSSVALLAIAHVSNVLGNIYPVRELCEKANECGAVSVVDGTQALAHLAVDVQALDCDFYAFSGHKMYATTGIGGLYGKTDRLNALNPSIWGGEMITHVSWGNVSLQNAPLKFEAGTPNISGALSLASATRFLAQNMDDIQAYEQQLYAHLLEKMQPFVDNGSVVLLGNQQQDSISLLSFYSRVEHAYDIAKYLAGENIAVRAGHHCAMPLLQQLGIEACVRVSIACTNTKQDIDRFISALAKVFNSSASETSTTPIEQQLQQAHDWSAKHRLLLLNSKALLLLEASKRNHETSVEGCEASVYLNFEDNHTFTAYSDSKVVRGILALLLVKINQWTEQGSYQQAQNFINDATNYFDNLGLQKYFSQGRRDGIHQVCLKISSTLNAQSE